MGLTGGIVDVDGLTQCLTGTYSKKVDVCILHIYTEVRRAKYLYVVDPISSSNLLCLIGSHSEKTVDEDAFLEFVQASRN